MCSSRAKTVGVTGGRGFLGRRLVARLRSMSINVVSIDVSKINNRSEGVDEIKLTQPSFVELQTSLKRCDGVVHLAALNGVTSCEANPSLCVDTNVRFLTDVCSVLTRTGANKWLIFASSKDAPNHEKALSIYAISKYFGEKVVGYFHKVRGLRASVHRFATIYDESVERRTVLSVFLANARLGRDLEVRDTRTKFNFVHIDDVVTAVALDVERHLNQVCKKFQTFNIETEDECTLPQLKNAIIQTRDELIKGTKMVSFENKFYCDTKKIPTLQIGLSKWHPEKRLQDTITDVLSLSTV